MSAATGTASMSKWTSRWTFTGITTKLTRDSVLFHTTLLPANLSPDVTPSNSQATEAFNQTAIPEEEFMLLLKAQWWILIIFALILGIAMILGNFLVILATFRNQRLRTYNGLLIVNLAIADFGVGCFIMPLVTISIFNQKWVFSQTLCNFFGSLVDLFCIASMLNLLCIAIDRYYATVYCMEYNKKMNRKKLLAFILWIWFQPLIIAITPFTGWSSYVYIANEFVCTADWALSLSYTIVACVTSIPIPLVIVIYLYIQIFRSVWKMERNMKKMCGNNFNLQKRHSGLKKTAKISIIVVGSFLICWTPHFTTMLYLAFKSYFGVTTTEWPDWLFTCSTLMGIGNSACNPIIYGIAAPKYREAMLNSLCCWRKKPKAKHSSSSLSYLQTQKFIVF